MLKKQRKLLLFLYKSVFILGEMFLLRKGTYIYYKKMRKINWNFIIAPKKLAAIKEVF